eukprot:s241_g20.t1
MAGPDETGRFSQEPTPESDSRDISWADPNLADAMSELQKTDVKARNKILADPEVSFRDFPFSKEVFEFLPQCEGSLAIDKRGLPYAIRCPGMANVVGLFSMISEDDLLLFQIYLNEWRMCQLEEHARKTGELCGVLIVQDMFAPDGLLNAWRKQGNKATVMRRVTGMMDEHYPGIMEKVLLVNAPWALHALIKVVTPLLPPRIVQKIQFVPVDQTPTRLLEFICPEKLPFFLGGKAENEEFVPARAAALLARPGTELFIKAGLIEECSLSLEANDEATCSVFVEGGLDIMLDCCFVDGEGKEEIVPPARVIEKDFNFTAMKKGELILRFDNTYSWEHQQEVAITLPGSEALQLTSLLASDVAKWLGSLNVAGFELLASDGARYLFSVAPEEARAWIERLNTDAQRKGAGWLVMADVNSTLRAENVWAVVQEGITFFLHRNALSIVDDSHPLSPELSSAFHRLQKECATVAFVVKEPVITEELEVRISMGGPEGRANFAAFGCSAPVQRQWLEKLQTMARAGHLRKSYGGALDFEAPRLSWMEQDSGGGDSREGLGDLSPLSPKSEGGALRSQECEQAIWARLRPSFCAEMQKAVESAEQQREAMKQMNEQRPSNGNIISIQYFAYSLKLGHRSFAFAMYRAANFVWPTLVIALRSDGPCSEWFDNAWLKSEGFSADVCCWGNHPACWHGADFSFESCCSDFNVRDLREGLAALGHQELDDAVLAEAALPLSRPGDDFAIRGAPKAEEIGSIGSQLKSLTSPSSFFRQAAPAAAMVLEHSGSVEQMEGLVLFIMTAPGNFARREAIRKTWLQMLGWPGTETVRYIFVMCAPDQMTMSRVEQLDTQLRKEQQHFQDLLILPWLEDVYWGWQHAAKTFLALLAVLERQPFAKHFACLHDDVYVNLQKLVEVLKVPYNDGLYLGNAYAGHEFVGHRAGDATEYQVMHGHLKMPIIMKGGLWVVDNALAQWVVASMSSATAKVPWRLWPSDDDTVGLVFGELDIQRPHSLRHGIEWFDWRLQDRCDGDHLVVAHDLKTPRELWDFWARQLVYGNSCHGLQGGQVRNSSRPEDFLQSATDAAKQIASVVDIDKVKTDTHENSGSDSTEAEEDLPLERLKRLQKRLKHHRHGLRKEPGAPHGLCMSLTQLESTTWSKYEFLINVNTFAKHFACAVREVRAHHQRQRSDSLARRMGQFHFVAAFAFRRQHYLKLEGARFQQLCKRVPHYYSRPRRFARSSSTGAIGRTEAAAPSGQPRRLRRTKTRLDNQAERPVLLANDIKAQLLAPGSIDIDPFKRGRSTKPVPAGTAVRDAPGWD